MSTPSCRFTNELRVGPLTNKRLLPKEYPTPPPPPPPKPRASTLQPGAQAFPWRKRHPVSAIGHLRTDTVLPTMLHARRKKNLSSAICKKFPPRVFGACSGSPLMETKQIDSSDLFFSCWVQGNSATPDDARESREE